MLKALTRVCLIIAIVAMIPFIIAGALKSAKGESR